MGDYDCGWKEVVDNITMMKYAIPTDRISQKKSTKKDNQSTGDVIVGNAVIRSITVSTIHV